MISKYIKIVFIIKTTYEYLKFQYKYNIKKGT